MPFFGMFGIVICGGASVFDKDDSLVHMIAAGVAFVCLTCWVAIINFCCLMPLLVCAVAGRGKPIWRIEVGLVSSVYTVMVL